MIQISLIDELIDDFFDSLEDKIFYFNTSFLYENVLDHYTDIIDEDLFNSIVEGSHQKQNGKTIMKLLGLIESNLTDEEDIIHNRKSFIDCMINTDGLKHTLSKELLEYVGQETTRNKQYFIHSTDNYIGEYDIKEEYFKDEFNNNKMVFSHTATENLFNWRM